jgi:hypothetical protein
MKKISILPVILLWMVACTGQQEKNATDANIETIPIDVRDAVYEGNLFLMVDTSYYEIIPLETNDSCLIAEVTRLYLKGDKIIVYDERAQGAYIFNRKDGSFHARVRAIGNGPGEYPHGINDIGVSEHYIIVLAPPFGIMLYDFDGRFVKKISLQGSWGRNVITLDEKNFYLPNDWSGSDIGCFHLFRLDTEHNKVYSYMPYPKKDDDNRRGWSLDKYYCYNGENFRLFMSTIDIIYNLGANDEITPVYAIDIVHRGLPKDIKTGDGYTAMNIANRDKLTMGIDDIAETSRFLYVRAGSNYVIYDKKEKKTISIAMVYTNPVWTNMAVESLYSTAEKDIVTTYVSGQYLYRSCKYIQQEKIPMNSQFDKDFFEVMKKAVDEEDNPAVIVLKLKE